MRKRIPPGLGRKLLAVWLILMGVVPIVHLQFAGLDLIMAALAVLAGVFIFLER